MLDIPKVSKRILKTLDKEGWTVEKLAVAKTEDLTEIQGIGPTTAWRVIVEARRLNRASKAEEPVVIDPQWLTPPPPATSAPRGLNLAPPPKPEPAWLKDMTVEAMEAKYQEMAPGAEIRPMSIRVKRNWLRQRLIELS